MWISWFEHGFCCLNMASGPFKNSFKQPCSYDFMQERYFNPSPSEPRYTPAGMKRWYNVAPTSMQRHYVVLMSWARWDCLCNSVDPDNLAFEEANWSSLFVVMYVNLYQKPGLSKIDWLEITCGCGILIYSAWQGELTHLMHFPSFFTREITFVTIYLFFLFVS